MEAKQDQLFLCVKVGMDGAPYLGKIDLKTYKNYKDQSTALEKMFSGFSTGQISRVTPLSDGASSAPISILENHELASIVLDYKRECGRDSVL